MTLNRQRQLDHALKRSQELAKLRARMPELALNAITGVGIVYAVSGWYSAQIVELRERVLFEEGDTQVIGVEQE